MKLINQLLVGASKQTESNSNLLLHAAKRIDELEENYEILYKGIYVLSNWDGSGMESRTYANKLYNKGTECYQNKY